MAYAVSRPDGSWELRSSRSTASGPRSRTLVTFRELSPELAARAAERSQGAVSAQDAVAAARRAGAPVAGTPATRAAIGLASALARGERISGGLARVIGTELAEAEPPSAAERAAAPWAGASLTERGRALAELLDLADATGRARRPTPLSFPPLAGTPE